MGYQVIGHEASNSGQYPVVMSTWPFVKAVRASWRAGDNGFSVVDFVVKGCSTCEEPSLGSTFLATFRGFLVAAAPATTTI
ncbi:hypothetical protein TB1_031843 [Malus domestica]